MANFSFVLSIISAVISLIPAFGFFSIIFAPVSIIIGVISHKKEKKTVIAISLAILSVFISLVINTDVSSAFLFLGASISLSLYGLLMLLLHKKNPFLNIDKLKKETVLYKPFYIRHIAGLGLSNDSLCTISFTNKKIIINQVKDNKILKKFTIDNTIVMSVDEDTIVEKRLISGDSIGNAVLGGLLFGSIGAIVGAASGNNIMDIKQDLDVLKIKYCSNGEEKCVLLLCEDKYNYDKFISLYNKFILKLENKEIENVEL